MADPELVSATEAKRLRERLEHPERGDTGAVWKDVAINLCETVEVQAWALAVANDRIEELEAALANAAEDLDADHQPAWASEKAKAAGKEPVWCQLCGAADGSWPCTASIIAGEIRTALNAEAPR